VETVQGDIVGYITLGRNYPSAGYTEPK